MTDFRLNSSVRSTIFKDYYSSHSMHFRDYSGFSISSMFDNGSFFDFGISSEFMNRNGDLSMSSYVTFASSGDMGKVFTYSAAADVSTDLYITSSFNYNTYTSMSLYGEVVRLRVIDFEMYSSVNKAKFSFMDRKSLIRKSMYTDGSIYNRLSYGNRSYITSYGLVANIVKRSSISKIHRFNLESYLNQSVFSISMSSGFLNEVVIPVGNVEIGVDYQLGGFMQDAYSLSVTTIFNLSNGYYNSGSAIFSTPSSFSTVTYDGFSLEYHSGDLEDINSARIEMSITRDIIDYESNLQDHVSIDLHFKELDIREYVADIHIPFADILKTFTDSLYFGYIDMPKKESFIENSVILIGFRQLFKVDKEASKGKVSGFSGGFIVKSISAGGRSGIILDEKNTGIKLPLSASKFVRMHNHYNFSRHFSTINSDFSRFDTNTENLTVGYKTYFSMRKDVISGTPTGYSVECRVLLKNIAYSSEYRGNIYIGSNCTTNGILRKEYKTADDIDLNAVAINRNIGKISFKYSSLLLNVEELVSEALSFRYNNNINLNSISTKISARMEYNGFILTLSDSYYKIKPDLIYGYRFNDVVFVDNFVYTDKSSLSDLMSRQSRFTANLMFNGEDVMSIDIPLTVIEYVS